MTSQKKMGRPTKEFPRKTPLGTKVTKPEADAFKEYCTEKGKGVSDVLRDYILSVIKK